MSGFSSPPTLTVGTTAGSPATGSWAEGQMWFDTNDALWICSDAGVPGAWQQITQGTAGPVLSVFGRGGAVVAASGDYTAAQVTNALSSSSFTNGYGITGATGATPTPAVSLTSSEAYISGTVALSANTPTNINSVATLAAGTWLIIGRAQVQGTVAAVAALDIWIGPNSASATAAYAGDSADIGNLVGGTEQITITVAKIVTLGSPTTVYLNAQCSQAATVQFQAQNTSVPNATGITAIRVQ